MKSCALIYWSKSKLVLFEQQAIMLSPKTGARKIYSEVFFCMVEIKLLYFSPNVLVNAHVKECLLLPVLFYYTFTVIQYIGSIDKIPKLYLQTV